MNCLGKRFGWLAAAGALVTLAGCPAPAPPEGSEAQPTQTAAPTPTDSAAQPAAGMRTTWGPDDGIVIGSYMSLTGGIATYGQSSNMAMGMAIEEINDRGGVLGGRKLRLVVEDSESKPEQSTVAAQRLIDVHHAVCVVGEVASSNSLAAAPVCEQAGIPMLSPSSTNPEVTLKGKFIFRACFTDDQQGAYVALFAAKHKGYRKAAILQDISSDYSKGLTKVITERFTEYGGTIERTEGYQQGDPDFSAQLTKLKGLGLDVIFLPGYYQDVGKIIKQARELGLTTPFVGADGWDSPVLVELAGDYLDQDCYFVNHYSKSEDRPEVKRFVQGFKERYNQEPDALAACAYDAIGIVAKAIDKAGNTDPKQLRDAIAATKDYHGVTGVITINAERNALKPCVVLAFKQKEQVIETTLTPADI